MTKSYINSRTINHDVIYSYTVLYSFNQQLTNPYIGLTNPAVILPLPKLPKIGLVAG